MFIVRGVGEVGNLKMDLDSAKQSPLGVCLFVCFSASLSIHWLWFR